MKSPVYECDRCRKQFTTCRGYAKQHRMSYDENLTRLTTVAECFNVGDRYRVEERVEEDPETGAPKDSDLAAELSLYRVTVESARELLYGRPQKYELCSECDEQLSAFLGGAHVVKALAAPELDDDHVSTCGCGYVDCGCAICAYDPKGEWAAEAVAKQAKERAERAKRKQLETARRRNPDPPRAVGVVRRLSR